MSRLFNPYADSDKNKVMVSEKYGFLPKSIWSIKKDKNLVKYINDRIGGKSYQKGIKKKKGEKDLSLLNPNVMYHILKYYSEEGDLILAPYSSRGVVGFISNLMGRHSFNTEIVPDYVKDIVERRADVLTYNGNNGYALEFYVDDATIMKTIPDNFATLTYFNPPYWNVEKYKSVDGQMSDYGTYEEFLEFYKKAIEAKFRKTRPGGLCIANLNDFRKEGVFYSFHVDTINLMKEAGFVQHDIIINEIFSRSLTSIGSIEERGLKIMCKTHEYIMIFKKPYEDGTVWKNYHEYRETLDISGWKEQLLQHHKDIGFEPDGGYTFDTSDVKLKASKKPSKKTTAKSSGKKKVTKKKSK